MITSRIISLVSALALSASALAASSGESDFIAVISKASQGDAEAQFNLGMQYYKGEGVPQSHLGAAKWWRKAAEQGHAEAQCNLGSLYYNGEGVPQSYTEAVSWYAKAAEQECAEAQYLLGISYLKGTGVSQDKDEGIVWLQKAASHGNAAAADCLRELGVEP